MRIGPQTSPATAPSIPGGRGRVWTQDLRSAKADGAEQDPSKGQSTEDVLALSLESRAQVAKLQARDQQVRAHEAAHMAAGGGLVRGGATYSYQQGPDGKRYAVGGEVRLDASAVPDNPRATIAKAEQLRAAALAPADPSGQDRAVAAEAAAMAAQAAMELGKQQRAAASNSPANPPGLPVGASLDIMA